MFQRTSLFKIAAIFVIGALLQILHGKFFPSKYRDPPLLDDRTAAQNDARLQIYHKLPKSRDILERPLVLVVFWASWCTPCLQEFPSLSHFQNSKYSKDVGILPINIENHSKVKRVLKKYAPSLPFFQDTQGVLQESFHVLSLPTSLLLKDGQVVWRKETALNFKSEEFLQILRHYI